MENKDNEAPITCTYDDFEPMCKWRREEGCDLLEVHGLQDFEREQLKVRINLGTTLVITGERPLKNNIRSRFRKEIKISKHCEIDEIRVKFGTAGILHVSLPKKTSKKISNSGDVNASLPSNYLIGLESSTCCRLKLAAQGMAVVVFAMAIAAFVYKPRRCVQVES
ncbi:hypothetical protein P3X46_034787 [Hevea brasiliensis]|uniref:SHSP domain-containing protein n=1 Tax=Hevea brasiliensis TaxID=3981 RepID=A0ABQ9KCB2_HEVBR|nr:uncharacterized protein LOC110647236 [Hevea brasiliensis]KAJ9131883.1 hypothetical protein P3X46_034787 [Hevea brasiliensis]